MTVSPQLDQNNVCGQDGTQSWRSWVRGSTYGIIYLVVRSLEGSRICPKGSFASAEFEANDSNNCRSRAQVDAIRLTDEYPYSCMNDRCLRWQLLEQNGRIWKVNDCRGCTRVPESQDGVFHLT
jgi:hypothetical protein